MTTYIDPTVELPQNLGEIYSDRNLRIIGQTKINASNASQLDTYGVQILCTPLAGGAESISILADGTYTLGVGSSLWMKIPRSGTATVTPEIYAAGAQPKCRKDYVQVFYMVSSGVVIALSSYLIKDTLNSTFGYSQKTWDAVVGTAGDPSITHTDLQTAITDVGVAAPSSGGWILVKKMCAVSTTITTPATKPIKLHFQGYGTGMQASGSPGTGITFSYSGCQLVGLGQITGFTTGVNLNNQTNCRIEMAFSSNTTNINYGTLTAAQYDIEGSIGLSENSHITTSTTHGIIARWNNTSKRWEPATGVTVDDSSNFATTANITCGTQAGGGWIMQQMGNTTGCRHYLTTANASGNYGNLILAAKSQGTLASPTSLANGDGILGIYSSGYSPSSTWCYTSMISMEVDGAPSGSSVPGRLVFSVTRSGDTGTTERMRIANSGYVGIGTTNPLTRLQVGDGSAQTNALISARKSASWSEGNAFEWGHSNSSGYANTLGCMTGGGQGFLAFNAEHGTNANTYRTRGVRGSVITGFDGNLYFSTVDTASADNQTATTRMTIANSGVVTFASGPIFKIRTITTNSIVADDYIVLVNSAGALGVTLPAHVTGKVITIKSINSGVITISPASGLIDGAANFALNTQYQGATFASDGSNWHVISVSRIAFYE